MRVARHPASTIITQTKKTNPLERAVDNAKALHRGPPRALIPYGTIVLNKTTITVRQNVKNGASGRKNKTIAHRMTPSFHLEL